MARYKWQVSKDDDADSRTLGVTHLGTFVERRFAGGFVLEADIDGAHISASAESLDALRELVRLMAGEDEAKPILDLIDRFDTLWQEWLQAHPLEKAGH